MNSLPTPAEADSDDHLLVAISVFMTIRSSAVTQPHLHLPPFLSRPAGYERWSLVNLEEEEEWKGTRDTRNEGKTVFLIKRHYYSSEAVI